MHDSRQHSVEQYRPSHRNFNPHPEQKNFYFHQYPIETKNPRLRRSYNLFPPFKNPFFTKKIKNKKRETPRHSHARRKQFLVRAFLPPTPRPCNFHPKPKAPSKCSHSRWSFFPPALHPSPPPCRLPCHPLSRG